MMEEIAWKSVPTEIEELKKNVFGPQSNQLNMIVSEPFGVHAQPTMEEVIKEISQFEVRSDDIWIITYPKCGTTWTQVSKPYSYPECGQSTLLKNVDNVSRA